MACIERSPRFSLRSRNLADDAAPSHLGRQTTALEPNLDVLGTTPLWASREIVLRNEIRNRRAVAYARIATQEMVERSRTGGGAHRALYADGTAHHAWRRSTTTRVEHGTDRRTSHRRRQSSLSRRRISSEPDVTRRPAAQGGCVRRTLPIAPLLSIATSTRRRTTMSSSRASPVPVSTRHAQRRPAAWGPCRPAVDHPFLAPPSVPATGRLGGLCGVWELRFSRIRPAPPQSFQAFPTEMLERRHRAAD